MTVQQNLAVYHEISQHFRPKSTRAMAARDKLNALNGSIEYLEQTFANYYQLREETYMSERTQNASLNTQVVLLTPVWADRLPVFPNKRLLIPFGFIIAILVALTAGFIKEYFDDSIKRPDDSMRYIGVPTLLSFGDKNPAKELFVTQAILQALWRWLSRRGKHETK